MNKLVLENIEIKNLAIELENNEIIISWEPLEQKNEFDSESEYDESDYQDESDYEINI